MRYSPTSLDESELDDVEQLASLTEGEETVWVDVRGLGDEQVLQRIGEIFELHPLALEDAVNVPQRAKSQIHDGHHIVVARVPIAEEEGNVDAPQVCMMIGRRVLLTFQERYFGFFDPVRDRIRAGIGPIRELGPDYLAYALLDCMVDLYYGVAERMCDRVEDLEDEASLDPGPDLLPHIHRARRELVIVRRIGRPQRESITMLISEPSPFITDDVRTYLRDVGDHIAQVMELVDSAHETALGTLEVYLSGVSHRTNEIMKVLTLMASIFIPLTFIAGIYGMNFEYMPELNRPRAYPLVLGMMLFVALGMVGYFWHRGWLGRRRRRKRRGE